MSRRRNRDDSEDAGPPRRRCPICGLPQTDSYRPFCSKRCADVDLGRWLRGAYAIPGGGDAEEDEAPARGDGGAGGEENSSSS